jgi:hypothetical protein
VSFSSGSTRKSSCWNLGGGCVGDQGEDSDSPVSLLSEGVDFVIVDERAMKPAIWENYLSQRLIDTRGTALLISTPRGKGWFYEAWKRGQGTDPSFASWNHPSWTNPHLDRSLIEEERGRLPERVFRQEYEGQFIEGSGAVFRNVRECARGGTPARPDFAGLDLARVETRCS